LVNYYLDRVIFFGVVDLEPKITPQSDSKLIKIICAV